MSLKVGELFAGYGGLGMGVSEVWDAEMAWYSEIDKGALKILEHRFPDVPNVGDVTTVNWSQVKPVDILTGGSPCQDLSHAGKRAGMTDGTRSNLWVAMREAIAQLRPPIVVWENVRGAYSAGADSALESDPGLLASVRRRDGEPVLRAIGRVLGDLSDLGYDASWHGLFAGWHDSSQPHVGATHKRFRVFVVATDANGGVDLPGGARADQRAVPHGDGRGAATALLPTPSCSDTNGAGQHGDGGLDLRTAVSLIHAPEVNDGQGSISNLSPDGADDAPNKSKGRATGDPALGALLPTPRATDGTKGGPSQRGSSGDLMLPSAVANLLPTPTSRDHKDGQIRREPHRPDDVDTLSRALTLLPTPTSQDANASGGSNASNVTLTDATVRTQMGTQPNERLLATPRAFGSRTSRHAATTAYRRSAPSLEQQVEIAEGVTPRELDDAADVQDSWRAQWGDYAAAIARWEHALGRPAPAPTMTSSKGNPQLSPAFVEWMMGLPAGWVTDTPGITRNEALRALGNGVVPQQAAVALRTMLAWEAVA